MTLLRWRRLPALGAGLLVLACGGSGGGGMGPCTPGPATQLVKTSGDPGAWYLNNPVPTPLSVTARDANNCPVSGVVVNWAVGSGGGGVSPAQTSTSASGVATTTDSIGSTSPQTVTATFTGLTTPVTFSATASPPPPTASVSVSDNVFSPASSVVQTGGTVTWTWGGVNPHTVSFTGGPESGTPAGTPQTSGTYQRTFTSTGKFSYFCRVHANMTATVTVVH